MTLLVRPAHHTMQVFYCWSRSADCVLEVECTGRWRAAFDALREQGVLPPAIIISPTNPPRSPLPLCPSLFRFCGWTTKR
jgi:hypothetical protein